MPITLGQNEKILLLTRRHHIILYAHTATTILSIAVLIAGYGLARTYLPALFEYPQSRMLFAGGIFLALFIVDYIFIIWLDYYLDVWIVTSERVVNIELKGLFRRQFSEFKLSRVQDITVEVHGILPTLLDYGDVHIQTAGESRQFIFSQIPHPYKAKEVIIEAHDAYMARTLQHQHIISESV